MKYYLQKRVFFSTNFAKSYGPTSSVRSIPQIKLLLPFLIWTPLDDILIYCLFIEQMSGFVASLTDA
jgi:hypothetical protein